MARLDGIDEKIRRRDDRAERQACETVLPRSRTIGSIIFDTPNVGAYVIQAANPVVNTTDTNFPGSGVLNVCHNGSITMTTNVDKSQKNLGPLGVK